MISFQSCIIKRYCEKRFVPNIGHDGIDYGVTKVQVRDREIKVNIFDMARHPFFTSESQQTGPNEEVACNECVTSSIRTVRALLLVYDVGLRESFDALELLAGRDETGNGLPGQHGQHRLHRLRQQVDLTKRRVVDEGEGRLVGGVQRAFFSSITDMCENGGKRPVAEVSVGFTKEQADTIRRIRSSKDSWDMLGVKPGATREEVNKAYRKLAVCCIPTSVWRPEVEDAFKARGGTPAPPC
ncbi:unnamed protein product [Pleuronectes platessa]|uniref:J domain-containing protein n=1 Tax=Pleuronectes platessa TaxID=8262 RepID=A0A9N7YMJ2_PLEPL|nr:unnamed protein product [Pleuronectes platessa]